MPEENDPPQSPPETAYAGEGPAGGSLSHAHLVKVYAAGSADGCHYIAMELIEGETLGDWLKRGPLLPAEALRILAEACRALEYGWQRAQLIHRDIKPGNLFLARNGDVKVGDLGLAKTVGGDTTGLTQTGSMMGTPHYISPEQARGDLDIDYDLDAPAAANAIASTPSPSAPLPWRDYLAQRRQAGGLPKLLVADDGREVRWLTGATLTLGLPRDKAIYGAPVRDMAVRVTWLPIDLKTTVVSVRRVSEGPAEQNGSYLMRLTESHCILEQNSAATAKLADWPLPNDFDRTREQVWEVRAIGDEISIFLNGRHLGNARDAGRKEGDITVSAGPGTVLRKLEYAILDG